MESNKATPGSPHLTGGDNAASSLLEKPTTHTGSTKGARSHHGKTKVGDSDPKTPQDYTQGDKLDMDLLGIGAWCDNKD